MSLRSTIAAIPGARRLHAAITGRRAAPARPEGASDDAPRTPEVQRELDELLRTNRRSRQSCVDPTSPVTVTMTTHGDRIERVFLAIESIARGDTLPGRLILWLDDPQVAAARPRTLRRLERRGVEVRLVERGMRVHTKYYFYAASEARHPVPMVTSDDDQLYPRTWLSELLAAHDADPTVVLAQRAHQMRFENGALLPYRLWHPATSTVPSFAHLGTSVSGQLFPALFLDRVREAGTDFLEAAPQNDDIWLHHLAVKHGFRVAQVHPTSQNYEFVPATQHVGLYLTNVGADHNDDQIRRSYSSEELALIAADAERDLAMPAA